jgi:protein-disulfide isomerase
VVAQKKVQIQKKSGLGKVYLALGVVAVLAAGAFVMSGGEPKPDTFQVDPGTAASTAEGYLLGRPDAPVQVLEWADFECPGCMQFATLTEPDVRKRLVETGQVSFRYFFYPLTDIHRSAASAAYAAACAADQNKFWEMHDAIYNGFDDWAGGRARDPKPVFQRYAGRLGLDERAWSSCYDSDKHRALITSHVAAGLQRGVQSTPTFFIGDRQVAGAISYDRFKAYVDSALARAPQSAAPAAPAAPAATGDSARSTAVPPAPPAPPAPGAR